MEKVTTAFVLGAGLGTRLRPWTEHCPKPLLPIGDLAASPPRPLVTHTLDRLADQGFERVIINTHHCPDCWPAAFPGGSYRGMSLTFRHEPILLETAGGLKNIEDLLDGPSPILLYNGDILSTLPLSPLIDAHGEGRSEREITLALRRQGPPANICFDAGGRPGPVLDIRSRFHPGREPNVGYTGIAMVSRRFFQRLTAGRIESLVEVWIRMIEEANPPQGVVIDEGEWTDVGTPEEYQKARHYPLWSQPSTATPPL